MKAKKSYDNGGKYPKGLNKTPKKGLKRSKDDNKKMVDMDRLKDPRPPRGLKKSEEDNKKMIKMRKGGRMGLPKDISGMGRFGRKLKKLKPIGAKKIMTGEMMEAASDKARKLKDPSLRKTVAEVEKPRRKKRRKFEMGGTLSAPNVNLRGEGKKKKKTKTRGGGDMLATTARPERMEKIAPKGPDVIGLAKKVKPGTIKKSSAKIPVPAKKKRRPRRK